MCRTECERRCLDATIAVGAMIRAVKRHDGGGAKDGDCFLGKDCSVAMFGKEGIEGSVGGVGGVRKVFMRFLKCKDVEVLGRGKIDGTGGGVVETLVPRCDSKDGCVCVV